MKYNAEQITFMLHEAIDENREYKSWHVSTQHLMTLVEMVVAEEREACAKLLEDTADDAKKVDPNGFVWQAIQKSAELIRARGNP
jgi:hypothetical protein